MRNIETKYAKRSTLTILMAVVLGAGGLVSNVSAQNARVFEIQVPFDFVVLGRTYEAAKYRIGRLNQTNPDTLVLNTSTGKTLLILQTQRFTSGEPTEFSMLSFSRYGDTHYLDAIRASGDSYESRLPSIRSDRRSRNLAKVSEIVNITTKSSRSKPVSGN